MAVIITDALVTSPDVGDEPLTHARIGYNNILTADNISGTAGSAEFPLASIAIGQTYERWEPVSDPATVTIDAGTAVPANYIGIAGLGLSAVKLESSPDNATWTERVSFSSGDMASMGLFNEATFRYWRVTLTGGTPSVISIYVGVCLQMERAIYGGHSPLTMSRKTAFRPIMSETGQWLGKTIRRAGLATSFDWNNLTADWYRSDFDPFVVHARQLPFFIAWRPEDYPLEVGYCWTNEDIQPSNIGTRDLMSVSLNVEGFDE